MIIVDFKQLLTFGSGYAHALANDAFRNRLYIVARAGGIFAPSAMLQILHKTLVLRIVDLFLRSRDRDPWNGRLRTTLAFAQLST